MEETNQAGNKKIYIAIIIFLLLGVAVSTFLLIKQKGETDASEKAKTELDARYKAVTDSLQMKVAELDQMQQSNTALNADIAAKEEEIKKDLEELKMAKGSAAALRSKLNAASAKMDGYEASIKELQDKVTELTKQNQELTNQNGQLTNDLNSEKQTTSQLTEQNKGLAKKVELGALLHLSNITVEGIKKDRKGNDSKVNKAKQAESLKISFETGDNKVLENGSVSLYIRIIGAKGETIAVADQGSGTFKSADGQDIQFTKKADFDWSQSNKKIVVYWSQNVQTSGTYKVEIYQSGYLVGQGSVTMK